jgi:ligand-binding sensor protein
VCNNKDGNCKTGEQDCGAGYDCGVLDMCLKATHGKAVSKSCANQAICDKVKSNCKKEDKCDVYCCSGYLCNASSSFKSETMLTFMAPLMAVARYLM